MTAEVAWLRHGIGVIINRAATETKAGAPAPMVATYVAIESLHVLRGHTLGPGVDCLACCSGALRDNSPLMEDAS